MIRWFLFGGLVALALLTVGLDSSALAAITGSGDVDPSDPNTWTSVTTPLIGNTASGTVTVTVGGSSALSSKDAKIGVNSGASGVVSISGSGSTWNNSSELYVGYSGTGSLTINSGGGVTNAYYGHIGYQPDSAGSVTVTGTGSTLNNGQKLFVGDSGRGSLTISSGGSVSDALGFVGNSSAGNGSVTVTGMGSTWNNASDLAVGNSGTGSLTISNGGKVSDFGGSIATNVGSSGSVEVSGSGSTWNTTGQVTVGNRGTGSMTISSGGSVTDAMGYVGLNEGSTGTVEVSGSGSTWKNSNNLGVGAYASGSMTISSGGSVTNTFGSIGSAASATGCVSVSGSGSTWNNSSYLNVGTSGSGSLTISSGGSVTNTIGYIGKNSSGTGSVTVTGSGSTWNNTSELNVGGSGTGSLTIKDGGSVSNTTGYIGHNMGSTGTVEVSGSTWSNSLDLSVGTGGSGTVTQNDGNVNVGGTLRLADADISSGTYNLRGGTLSVGGLSAGSGTYAFNFNGGTLAAKNDFSTTVNAALSNTATIDTQGHSVTWNGVLSGNGKLVKTGTGTLTLNNGSNLYAGGTDVEGGALVGTTSSIMGNLNIASGAEAIFQQSGIVTYANTITGSGTLSTTGDMFVATGLVSPGNSIGTLTIGGNFATSSTSTLNIETAADGHCDVLNVDGTATINGGTVSVGTTGGYKTGSRYTFLTSNGLTVATDPNLLIDSAFLSGVLGYDALDMWFTLATKGSYVDEARTLNQYDMANYLDAHKSGATGDFATVLDALNLQTGDGARAAFDAMSGEIHGGLATISIENNERFLRSISQRMQMRNITQGFDVAASHADPSLVYVSRTTSSFDGLADRMSGWTTWCEGYGVGGALANNGNASGLGYSTGGLIVGMERQLNECTLLGFAGGYANSHTTLQSRADGAEIDGGQFSLYLHREIGDGYLTGVAGYGHNSFDVGRSIVFGSIDRAATSKYDGNNYSTYVELGRNIHGRYLHWQPLGALEYIGVRQNSFTETGANSVDLDVQAMNANAFRSLLGTRLLTGFRTNSDHLITWNASTMWRHEFLNDGRVLDASFVDQTGTAFAAYGANVDRDAAIVGTGLNYAVSSHCSLYANYDLIFSRNYTANAGLGGFQYVW